MLGVVVVVVKVVKVVVGLDWEGLDLRGEIEWEIGGSGEVSCACVCVKKREVSGGCFFSADLYIFLESDGCDNDL